MMICPKCGAQLNDDAKFCIKCGEQMGGAQPAAPVQPVAPEPAPFAAPVQPVAPEPAPFAAPVQPVQQSITPPVTQVQQPITPPPVVPVQPAAPVQPVQPTPVMQQSVYAPLPQGMPPRPAAPTAPMPMQQPITPAGPMPMQQNFSYGQSPQPKKSNAALIVVIIILSVLLIAVAALGVLLYMKSNNSGGGSGESSGLTRLEELIVTAQGHMEAGEYEEALDAWIAVLDEDETNETAVKELTGCYLLLAERYEENGEYEKALEILDNADERADKTDIREARGRIAAAGKAGWQDSDFVFSANSNTVRVDINNSLIIYSDGSSLQNYISYDYEEFADVFATDRGLALGMNLDDYKRLYNVQGGYAVWELYSGENNGITSFYEYTNQRPADMYDMGYNNVWLDIGFYRDGNVWKTLQDTQVQNIWFCDEELDDYDEVLIFAVNFDYQGKVIGLSLDYLNYNQDWVEWQDWQ